MTQTEVILEDDLLVSLTFHNFSAEMLKEFAQKIVKPYFLGNMNEAIRCLMEKAVAEEKILQGAVRKKP
jgi:GR25 family glycosyltransferase involved in LPS biosynthesis